MPLITTNLESALSNLRQGKPVAIPTETVYGLAAMIDNEEAIRAVFAMKNRPLNHPLIVHVAKDWDLYQLVHDIPEYAKILIKHFWPGPLTLVFNCKPGQVNPLITGGQSTVAIRCPAHPLAQALLHELAAPLVAPSANPFGKVSPTTAEHVQNSFSSEDLLILDGGRCTIGIESTIIDASQPQSYQILRHGLIDSERIAQIIATECSKTENAIRVPGKLESHYQPHKPLHYFQEYQELVRFCEKHPGQVYAIANKQPQSVPNNLFHILGTEPQTAAFDLYFQLRKADTSNAKYLAIELPKDTSEWQGIRERIIKAGAPKSH
ncbi:MAG: L-threonylcarbamoyladenylate synthase [Legionella sp.]|jgi:L-threonylcarbamoyladenylate synthase